MENMDIENMTPEMIEAQKKRMNRMRVQEEALLAMLKDGELREHVVHIQGGGRKKFYKMINI